MSRLLERAFATPGHMGEDELRWLHSACEGKGLVIEMGSWRGRSSLAMASAKRLVCVDSWLGSPGEECEQDVLAGRIDPWKEWQAAIGPAMEDCNIVAERGDLRDDALVARLVKTYMSSADLVFIDASHDQASVELDIVIAKCLLKNGGILCGHDYGGSWTGVKAAVDVMVKSPRVVVGSIWVEGE